MLLTTFFTTKKDWQRGKRTKPSFSKFKNFYRSVMLLGLNATMVYDSFPEDIIRRYSTPYFQFVQTEFTDFDPRYGVNDVRYFVFDRLLRLHDDWRYVFILDAFDVRVKMNPCGGFDPSKLYVGSETDKLQGHPWMKARFAKFGGKYLEWYKSVDTTRKILNCGITGGHRDVMLELLGDMKSALGDPEIEVRKKANESINLNMAALNYIVYGKYRSRLATGAPVHSVYKAKEVTRGDVWFVHK